MKFDSKEKEAVDVMQMAGGIDLLRGVARLRISPSACLVAMEFTFDGEFISSLSSVVAASCRPGAKLEELADVFYHGLENELTKEIVKTAEYLSISHRGELEWLTCEKLCAEVTR